MWGYKAANIEVSKISVYFGVFSSSGVTLITAIVQYVIMSEGMEYVYQNVSTLFNSK